MESGISISRPLNGFRVTVDAILDHDGTTRDTRYSEKGTDWGPVSEIKP